MAFAPGSGDYDLDLDRRRRLGLVEAVWGEHKSPSQIASIIKAMRAADELVLVTRVSEEQVAEVLNLLGPEGDVLEGVWHHQQARCLTLPALPVADPGLGAVAILGAGSSDLAVASEAHLALACHGVASDLILDVGVAGLHRLLNRLDELTALPRIDRLCRHGGGIADGGGGFAAPAGDRRARVGGLWRQQGWAGRPAGHACQLCPRPDGGEH
jgi:NCAIR mutase (PurE)-related protein